MTLIAIILAAGLGKRMNSTTQNKTSMPLAGKPMVQYGIELFAPFVEQTLLVVGAYADSVKQSVQGENITFVEQTEQKGTGHAVQVAVEDVEKNHQHPTQVLIGYGDHLMLYTKEVIAEFLSNHQTEKATISVITSDHPQANQLGLGRIVRNESGEVVAIVEQKDATEEQRKITEINAALYCIDYEFLRQNIPHLTPSIVTQELYLTDLIEMAQKQGKRVVGFKVPLEYVGIGVNTPEQLTEVEQILTQRHV